jgi:hypothetical protein
MLYVIAKQVRGWISQFPEGTVGGKWRWSLIGPVPQVKEEGTGDGAVFEVNDELTPNVGEYIVQLQRLDVGGAALGEAQTSAAFQIPPVGVPVNIEIASPVNVEVTSTPQPVVNPLKKQP